MIKLRSLLKEQESSKTETKILKTTELNYKSGKWIVNRNPNVKQEVDQFIQDFIRLKDDERYRDNLKIVIYASESQVPNYDGEQQNPRDYKLESGVLSEKRIKNLKEYLDSKNLGVNVELTKPIIGKEKWVVPAGSTADDIRALAQSEKYTKDQWVRISAQLSRTTIPTPITIKSSVKVNNTARTRGAASNASNFKKWFENNRFQSDWGAIDYPSLLDTDTRALLDKLRVDWSLLKSLRGTGRVSGGGILINSENLPKLLKAFNLKTPEQLYELIWGDNGLKLQKTAD